jgi:BON domain
LARDGVVRLRGSAQNYQDRLAIEEATRFATGVVGIVNELRVKPCTALIERVFSSAPLTESHIAGALMQPRAIQEPAVKPARVNSQRPMQQMVH